MGFQALCVNDLSGQNLKGVKSTERQWVENKGIYLFMCHYLFKLIHLCRVQKENFSFATNCNGWGGTGIWIVTPHRWLPVTDWLQTWARMDPSTVFLWDIYSDRGRQVHLLSLLIHWTFFFHFPKLSAIYQVCWPVGCSRVDTDTLLIVLDLKSNSYFSKAHVLKYGDLNNRRYQCRQRSILLLHIVF